MPTNGRTEEKVRISPKSLRFIPWQSGREEFNWTSEKYYLLEAPEDSKGKTKGIRIHLAYISILTKMVIHGDTPRTVKMTVVSHRRASPQHSVRAGESVAAQTLYSGIGVKKKKNSGLYVFLQTNHTHKHTRSATMASIIIIIIKN